MDDLIRPEKESPCQDPDIIFIKDQWKFWSGTRALSELFKLVHSVLPAVYEGAHILKIS